MTSHREKMLDLVVKRLYMLKAPKARSSFLTLFPRNALGLPDPHSLRIFPGLDGAGDSSGTISGHHNLFRGMQDGTGARYDEHSYGSSRYGKYKVVPTDLTRSI